MRRAALTGVGGIVAALLGSLCCVGPLLFVSLGIGAGLASAFEPLRPAFGVAMLGLFGFGFWTVYGGRRGVQAVPNDIAGIDAANAPACGPGEACAVPTRRRRDVLILWTAAVLALVFWTFPTWSLWLL